MFNFVCVFLYLSHEYQLMKNNQQNFAVVIKKNPLVILGLSF